MLARKLVLITMMSMLLVGCFPHPAHGSHEKLDKVRCLLPEGCPIKEKFMR